MSPHNDAPRCPRCGARAQWEEDGEEYDIPNELYCPNGCFHVSFTHSRKKALKKWSDIVKEYNEQHRSNKDSL